MAVAPIKAVRLFAGPWGGTAMWRNPKYAQPDQPAAPADQGQRLATFDRGEGTELRVNLAEYNGHPYISIRVWERNQAGQWWPVKGKGCSIRMNEAAELAKVLDLAAIRPTYVPKAARPQAREQKPASAYSTPTASAKPFDEFGGEHG